jgi:Myb/SANT-like DNA-binding domain
MESKRVRSKNFSEVEKNCLFEIIIKYKQIIENNLTDGMTQAEKNLAWQKIAQEFNSTSQTGPRSASQLHALYNNLKKSARTNLLSDKVCGTVNAHINKHEIINRRGFQQNVSDSSAAYIDPQPGPSSSRDITIGIYHKLVLIIIINGLICR